MNGRLPHGLHDDGNVISDRELVVELVTRPSLGIHRSRFKGLYLAAIEK